MNFSVLPQAQSELDDAYEWYESQALDLGGRFLTEAVHVAHLRRKPGYWAARL